MTRTAAAKARSAARVARRDNLAATGCGRRPFGTEADAQAKLGSLWARCSPGARLPAVAFECPACGHWHIKRGPKPARTTVLREGVTP